MYTQDHQTQRGKKKKKKKKKKKTPNNMISLKKVQIELANHVIV